MFSHIRRHGLSAIAFFLLSTVGSPGVNIISHDKFYGGNGSVALTSPQVAIQGNGNLITSGVTTTEADGTALVLTRYKENGLLDTSFGTNGTSTLPFAGTPLKYLHNLGDPVIQPDGKILLPGTVEYDYGAGVSQEHFTGPVAVVWRFTATGQPDPTFNGTGRALWLTGGPNGGSHTSRGHFVAVQGDGKIVLAGVAMNLVFPPGFSGNDLTVWRFLANGTLDTSFNGKGYRAVDPYYTSSSNFYAEDSTDGLAIRPNGEIIVSCVRLPSIPGSDASWGYTSFSPPGTSIRVYEGGVAASYETVGLLPQVDNQLVIARAGRPSNWFYRFSRVLRTDAANAVDATFPVYDNSSLYNGPGSQADTDPLSFGARFFLASMVQQDGKLLGAGFWRDTEMGTGKDTDYWALLRFNADGTPDSTLHNGSHLYTEAFPAMGSFVNKLLPLSDGSFILVTSVGHLVSARKYKSGPPLSSVAFAGAASFQILGKKVLITSTGITNSGNLKSSALRVRLWASKTRFQGGQAKGSSIAVLGLRELSPGTSHTSVRKRVAFQKPAKGSYFTMLTLEEFSEGSYKVRDHVTLSGKMRIK